MAQHKLHEEANFFNFMKQFVNIFLRTNDFSMFHYENMMQSSPNGQVKERSKLNNLKYLTLKKVIRELLLLPRLKSLQHLNLVCKHFFYSLLICIPNWSHLWAEINLWKLHKNSMFVNMSNVIMVCYPSSEWEVPFNWEWVVGNSFKTITSCAIISSRKLTYFSSTSAITFWTPGTEIWITVKQKFGSFFISDGIIIFLKSLESSCLDNNVITLIAELRYKPFLLKKQSSHPPSHSLAIIQKVEFIHKLQWKRRSNNNMISGNVNFGAKIGIWLCPKPMMFQNLHKLPIE